MHGRLNSFQKTILQWNDMHPYNAVHVVRIPSVLNAEWLRLSLSSRLEGHGLTHLKLNRGATTYAYHGGRVDCDVKIISGEQDPISALRAEIEQQLNTPFQQRGRCNPFRFFAVTAKDSFFLGLAYFHPVADAESVVFLLRDLAQCGLDSRASEPTMRLDLYPDHRARLLRRHPTVIARKLLALPAQIRNLKQSHRPRCRDAQDMKNGFSLFSLGPERLRRLVVAGKSWELTVNDVLLALLMKSVSPLSDGRTHAKKRRKISVGCIVNLRQELGIDSARTFGLFLGSFTVTHAMPEAISLRELSGDIRRQTLVIKRHRLYLATPMELGFGRFVLRFFPPEQRKTFYQKNYPLWGGLTNMNLNSVWEQSNENGPMDYFRGVSTGPVTPLVFSVTTVGDHANVGLSYRSTVFSPEDIERVKSHFMRHLEQLQQQF
jgi:Condensation domain